jgi:EmrB/QacA subfamily drug resistance transporter
MAPASHSCDTKDAKAGDIIENHEISAPSSAALPMTSRRRWAVTAGVLMAMFMAALEVTIVGTAMPTVISTLGGLSHYSWVFSAYLITSTVPVPVWGKLSDIYGRRRLFQIGIGTFILGSMLSGMSHSMLQLILFRALQGLGAGILVPLAMTIIGDIYTLEERTRMQAVFSGVWGLSSIIGPFIGGVITDRLDWRWVFYINIPFGIAAAIVIGFALQEPPRTRRPNIDYAGALTLISAVTLLMLGLVEDPYHPGGLLAPRNLALVTAALVLFGLFLWVETQAADPIVPLGLFRNRVVAVAIAAGFCAGVGMFGAISFVPFFAQGVLGATATQAGSLLTPLLLSWVCMGILGGRVLLKVGFRAVATAGFGFMLVGLSALATSGRSTPWTPIMFELGLVGCGLGLVVLTLILASQQSVERTRLGLVTSLAQFARSIGGAVGVAVMGVVLSVSLTARLMAAADTKGLTPERARELAAHPNALIDPAARAGLSPEVMAILQGALAGALDNVFWMAAGCALIGLGMVRLLPSRITQPTAASCSEAVREKLLIEEMAVIDPEHEPSAVS